MSGPFSKLLPAAGTIVEAVERLCEELLTVGLEVNVWNQMLRNALRSQCWIGSRTLFRTGRSTWMSRVRKVSSRQTALFCQLLMVCEGECFHGHHTIEGRECFICKARG
jgi:hypothetical protein